MNHRVLIAAAADATGKEHLNSFAAKFKSESKFTVARWGFPDSNSERSQPNIQTIIIFNLISFYIFPHKVNRDHIYFYCYYRAKHRNDGDGEWNRKHKPEEDAEQKKRVASHVACENRAVASAAINHRIGTLSIRTHTASQNPKP